MSAMKLYAIELENRKVFLHVCRPVKSDHLFPECQVMFSFVKKNPPVRLLNEIEIDDVLRVDYYVKYFMRHYGIENVRGGSYSDEVLPDALLASLQIEIGATFDDYKKRNDLYEEIKQFYKTHKVNEVDETTKLNAKLENFQARQELLKKLSFEGSESVISDLDWLKQSVEKKKGLYPPLTVFEKLLTFRPLPTISSSERNRYKNIINNVLIMIDSYYDICDGRVAEDKLDPYFRNRLLSIRENQVEKTILVEKPQFVLDNIFLHPYSIPSWNKYLEIADELLENLTNVAYIMKNLREEVSYDLSQVPPDFEKRAQYSIEFLHR
jgi:hypothetical protein